ncbi:HK97-gp10 family putative phage morphogenesis protein [Streptomyces fradiae]|uniref:HK97-gp10 family putative phage morphogenesis protein n=1 Tax=Streptomyces fradiae TaxID=1906 RepID=UPI002941FC7D|nr:HK97-gp10 family putative phage morphogenesis protein [Streptomyces fradiae]WOI58605.1 HK97 gp10 family phage protein [Streptomyces fradiae]
MARRRRRGRIVRVNVRGLEQLRDQIEDLDPALRAAAVRAVRGAAEAVADGTREGVRVDSGNLRDSVAARYRDDGTRAQVGWWDRDDHYAVHNELGTSSMPAQPALGPAVEAERARIRARVRAEVRRELS